MAAVIATADMTTIKNTKILVHVEEALADLIVVSYCSDNKKFQGVLLDSNKSNLPFGVYSLHPAFSGTEGYDEKLHTVGQRYAYQETQYAKKTPAKSKPQPKQKMTVRLRPRKVLCSNCKGICNENNEIVDVTRKRKLSEQGDNVSEGKNPRSLQTDKKKSCLLGNTLIPKLSRLHPNEISSAINGATKEKSQSLLKTENVKTGDNSRVVPKCKADSVSNNRCDDRVSQELAFVNVSDDFGSQTDCDKTVTCQVSEGHYENTFGNVFSSARTLKICFGAGEGTVVKIPALVGDYNDDSGVSSDISKSLKPTDSKAAKKALKRAKKQAKRNCAPTDTSPVTSSGLLPSPRHIGALSPRNNVTSNILNVDTLQKKHRHKVKHKKKHKVDRKLIRDENTSKTFDEQPPGHFANIKKHCLKQKLSISLKRLSPTSYAQLVAEGSESDSDAWESDSCDDGVPEFPASGTGGGGGSSGRVAPGDVVWGKVVGFPWWPGRILSVTPASRAHVAWYASTTSSLMPCDSLSPFLQDYKTRFNKKKRGPYKEAVKQATLEARRNESQDPLASPGNASLPTVSPHPIDVFS